MKDEKVMKLLYDYTNEVEHLFGDIKIERRRKLHTAIISLFKSKQMSVEDIIKILVKLPLIIPVADKNLLATAIHTEMLKKGE